MQSVLKAFAIVVVLAGLATAAEEPSSSLNFVVVRENSGKPVRNAAVVLHPVNDHGKQEKGGYELKTDLDGKTNFDGVPYGKLRVQVLAHGFQTFGQDYEINQPTMQIVIKLKRPQEQFSIYKENPNDKKDDRQEKPPQ
jgi:hypothetical protein